MAFNQLRLREQVIGESLVELPDLVQHLELFVSVKPQIANELTDMGPVLLFDVSSVAFVAWA